VVRAAVPADDMMQAFAYRHLVPAESLQVAVLGPNRPQLDTARIVSATPVRIPAGGTARVQVSIPVGPMIAKVQFELDGAPDGITIVESRPRRSCYRPTPQKSNPA